MKRAALAVLCVAACGCGEGTSESGSCADGIMVNDDVYLGTSLEGPDPRAGRPVEGGIRPACNDSNGEPPGADRPTGLREVGGVPPEVAVYPEWSTSTIYINTGHFTELPDHPLHDRIYGSPERPRRRARGRPCRIEGEVESVVFGLLVRTGGRQVQAAIDARTRIEGFDRAGLPYLRAGDRVALRGYGCRREVMLARRITRP